MIKGRKCRETTSNVTISDGVESPKRKDVKLTINATGKAMASMKKIDYICKKSNRVKKNVHSVEINDHTIKDFFQKKINDTDFEHQSKKNMTVNGIEKEMLDIKSLNSTYCPENTQKYVQSNSTETPDVLVDNLNLNDSGCLYQVTPKPVTPHRIVCLFSEKNKTDLSEPVACNEITRSVRNKKREDLKSGENTPDEQPLNQTSLTNDKKHVLNSSANPSARQNTKNNKKSNKEEDTNNKKLTDFFPIRRSIRKTNKEVQQELLRSYEKAIIEQCEEGLQVKHFENKGRGVVTLRPFRKNEFVLEYIGELISIAEANRREIKYAKDESTGCYMYYFKHVGQQYCIDATEETGKLGRLVNHSRNGNLITKTVAVKGQPHLILVAKYDIKSGVELTYDYGDRSKESLTHHPWLAY
uniref:[histone H4]-lysine(20) N-methyltransferase n=1 Tax=Culicoides sonorensis TaxID=179676 RepID=A0A336M1X5_CULSO